MSKNTYYEYMAVLRSRDPRPPFNQLEALISSGPPTPQSTHSSVWLSVWLLGAGSATVTLIALTMWFLPLKSASNPEIAFQPIQAHVSTETARASAVQFQATRAVSNKRGQNDIPVASCESAPHREEPAYNPISVCTPTNVVAALRHSNSLSQFESIDIEAPQPKRFSVLIGGSASHEVNANVNLETNRLTDAFAGIGYDISKHVTLHVLGGEEVFAMPSRSTVMTYHDTTIIAGGNSYYSVIGKIEPSPVPEIHHAYWLGGSVRYSIGDVWQTFAEVGAAGSTQGMLLRESIGLGHDLSESFGLELMCGSDQLRTTNTRLTKLVISAALVYRR
jgi:hypothetical protein